MPEPPAVLGVGIDLEERAAFERLDPAAVERAADRWLSAEERVWCCSQTSLAEALLVVLCCKEAAFKAWSEGTAAHEVRLDLRGSTARGRGSARHSPVAVEVEWRRLGQRVVALAVATAPRP